MNKITKFDRTTAKKLSADIENVLKVVGTKHGISVRIKSGSYMDESLTFKIELATIDESGTVLTKEAQDFKLFANSYGLKPEYLGRSFTDYNGEDYTITGLKLRSGKYPILVKRKDGKVFKFPEKRVASAFLAGETLSAS